MSATDDTIIVAYHDNCVDGFAAASVFWSCYHDAAQYIPVQYDKRDEFIAKLRDAAELGIMLFVVDFSFTPEQLAELESLCSLVVMLDHHETALRKYTPTGFQYKNVTDRHYIYIDTNFCGAKLAWQYLYWDVSPPDLLDYIDDYDRWMFRFGDLTRAVNQALKCTSLVPHTLSAWAKLLSADSEELNQLIKTGKYLVDAFNDQCDAIIKAGASSQEFDGQQIMLCNAPPMFASEVGNRLAKQHGVALIWHMRADGKIACSLRSIGDINVAAIAEMYGGGGHKNAAGFVMENAKWLTLFI